MPHDDPVNGRSEYASVADELKQESERLRQLAEKLKAREEALAEMEMNYPALLKFAHAKLQKKFAETLEELPEDMDLKVHAKEKGAVPHDTFMEQLRDEMRRLEEGP